MMMMRINETDFFLNKQILPPAEKKISELVHSSRREDFYAFLIRHKNATRLSKTSIYVYDRMKRKGMV